MAVHRKVLLSALVALAGLTALTAVASASRGFSFGTQAFTGTDPAVTFDGESGSIICPVTLEGSLHRTVAKVNGTLEGFMTRGRVAEGSCRDTVEGATVQAELGEGRFPWHLRYGSFSGSLPSIEGIAGTVVANFTLNVRTIFGTSRCRYVGTWSRRIIVQEGLVTRISKSGNFTTTDRFPCAPRVIITILLTLTALMPVTLI